MDVPTPKHRIPRAWANVGLAPVVAVALLVGVKAAQAEEPAVTADEQPDGTTCGPSPADPAAISNSTPSPGLGGSTAGSDCQTSPDSGQDQDGAPGADNGASGATVPQDRGTQGGAPADPGGIGETGGPVGGAPEADGGGALGAGTVPSAPTDPGDRTGSAGPGGPAGSGRHRDHRGRHHRGVERTSQHGDGGTPASPQDHGRTSAASGAQSPVVSNLPPSVVSVPSGVTAGGPGVPPFLRPIYEKCGGQYGIPWEVLAAINRIETDFGANLNTSSAGAMGWMQFLPSTWRTYGVDANGDGKRDPYNPTDAICAAARYLRAAGGKSDLRRALFAYNHAAWYVDEVLLYARQYRDTPVAGVGSALPDPLPPETRLDRRFARSVAQVARAHEVDWALVLAVLRARADGGQLPTDLADVRSVARKLQRGHRRTHALGPLVRGLFPAQRQFDLTVIALARYNAAVGLRGLVEGMEAVKGQLGERVLRSPRLDIYEGGRNDIAAGRVDVRVLTVLLYLAERYRSVTVSCLITGHSYFTSSGNPSLHAFGRAVDISAVNGIPITGHQNPGGLTEHVLRRVLTLPEELQPSELISLFDLGGPSFALADHYDHIHIGF